MRLLLDPAAPEGNGGATPPPAPTTTAPPAQPPEWLGELNKLRDELAELKGERHRRQSQDREVKEKTLKDKGDYEGLIRERDERLAKLQGDLDARDKRHRAAERDRAIVEAIASTGLTLGKGAAEQLLRLWRDDFEVLDQDGGAMRVQTKDFKTPAQVARERLASDEYGHFVLAKSRGGSGLSGGGGATTTQQQPQGGARPSLLDRVAAAMEQRQAAHQASGNPLGLRSRRGG